MSAASLITPLANHLWQSTLYAMAVWVVTLTLRNNRAEARYWLWLSASLKFLIPFSLLISLGGHLGSRAAVSVTPPPAVSLAVESVMISPPLSTTWKGSPAGSSTDKVVATPLGDSRWPQVAVAIWMAGIFTVLIIWCRRWRRFASITRSATPFTAGRELEMLRRIEGVGTTTRVIPIAATLSSIEPGLFGILRPVLLLPRGIGSRLSDAQLEAIIAHELSHARRRDNLAAFVHMFAEAIFWFHPLIWWLGARMVAERESACDEDVLRRGGDPRIYAEAILDVCEFYLASPLTCVSGITGADLKKRIEAIVSGRMTMKLSFARKALVTFVGILSIAIPVLFGLMMLPPEIVAQPEAVPLPDPPPITAAAPPVTVGLALTPAVKRVTTVPQDDSLAMVIVLDKSGSMKGPDQPPNPGKLYLAKEASRVAANMMKDDHWFGEVVFDSTVSWAVPLQRVRNRDAIQDAIDRIQAAGETNLFPALSEAVTALHNVTASKKHVIAITDGRAIPADYEPLIVQLGLDGISLSTIAVGAGADRSLLSRLAERGHGRAYYVEDPARLPEIFAKETQIAQGQAVSAAQAIPTPAPQFDVAIIKPRDVPAGLSGGCRGIDSKLVANDRRTNVPLGECRITAANIGILTSIAYNAQMSRIRVPNVPDRYDVEGKAADPGTTTESQLLSMLQSLLAERFKLQLHTVTEEVSGYALVVDKGGAKFKNARDDEQWSSSMTGSPAQPPVTLTVTRGTLPELARTLSETNLCFEAKPTLAAVVDKTGLKGFFNYTLKWDPCRGDSADFIGIAIPAALKDQMGLKLEPAKIPQDFLVVDHWEKPQP